MVPNHTSQISNMTTTSDTSDFERHSKFYHWVKQQGVRISGVAPVNIPSKGMGIVAQQRIEVGEESASCSRFFASD